MLSNHLTTEPHSQLIFFLVELDAEEPSSVGPPASKSSINSTVIFGWPAFLAEDMLANFLRSLER